MKELPAWVPSDDQIAASGKKEQADLIAKAQEGNLDQSSLRQGMTNCDEQMDSEKVIRRELIRKDSDGASSTESDQKHCIRQHGVERMPVRVAMGKSPGEVAFFKLLHAELKKAIHFFDRAQEEFTIREERAREGMAIMKRPNSIMLVNDRWSVLAKSLYRLYKDLLLFETFAIMTYCSFSKILKKHDKLTGYDTRNAFMSNVVNKANFTNYPRVLEMIKRCEAFYDEVSGLLGSEGKQSLYEDERLFISMIQRLNEQAMNTAEAEGAPDVSERKEKRARTESPMLTDVAYGKLMNLRSSTTSLRSVVEDNEVKIAAVQEASEDESRKRDAGCIEITKELSGAMHKRPRNAE